MLKMDESSYFVGCCQARYECLFSMQTDIHTLAKILEYSSSWQQDHQEEILQELEW